MVSASASVFETVGPKHLCCGCGACVLACPAGAVQLAETPAGLMAPREAARHRCVKCGRCMAVCPGHRFELPRQDDGFAPADDATLECHWGWALEDDTRRNGASGGAVTALLSNLLSRGWIDGALVTRWGPARPLRTESFVARTPEELRVSQRSRYCPTPLLLGLSADHEGVDRLAVVGLPCHLQAVELLVDIGLIPAQRLVLKVGLICQGVLSYSALRHLAGNVKRRPEDVRVFEYRDKRAHGWPGDVYMETADGTAYQLPRSRRMDIKEAYRPIRCRLCPYGLNPWADIVFGDGYGATPQRDGISVVLVRTEVGALTLAAASGALALEPVSTEVALKAQQPGERLARAAAFQAAYRSRHGPELRELLHDARPEARHGPRLPRGDLRRLRISEWMEDGPPTFARRAWVSLTLARNKGRHVASQLARLLATPAKRR